MKKSLLAALVWATGMAATHAQVTQISTNKNLDFVGITGAKGIFVSTTDNRLYASDGTVVGTVSLSSSITFEDMCGMLGNKILFKGSNATAGSELFITDGTAAGTTLVKDIYAGATGSQIGSDVAILNGLIYFTAVTATEGREVWKSDGTAAGTTLLKDIVTGTGNSNTAADYNLFSNGNYLLFSAQSGTSGYELWKSDGSTAGTVLLSDINTGAASSAAADFFKFGNFVLFHATTAAAGKELWKTDGTTAGTTLVKDINPGISSSTGFFAEFFYEFNGRAYFNAIGSSGEELWSTDGTTANTQQVKDIQAGPNGSFNLLINAVTIGNKFIFPSGDLFGSRYELWQSDGTEAGTTRLKDFTSGGTFPIILSTYSFYGNGTQPLFQGNKIFLYAATAANGGELWITDGTEAGTTLVKDINPGAADGIASPSFQYTQNAIYFAADNGVNGNELWKSDGTAAGTTLVADINVGASESDPELWPIFNNKLTLSANNGDNAASDLYVLNGNVNPLPIKLTEFTAALVGSDAALHWTTLQEVNSDQFRVQRSLDGISFQNIGTVKAAGQSTSKQTYSFTDASITQYGKQTIYYRLQVVDKDGKTELTKVVTINLSTSQWNVKLVNNPVQSSLQMNVTGTIGSTTIRITDMAGKSYHTTTIQGSGIIHIPVDNLPAGIYFITAENSQGKKTGKFIKN